MSEPKNEVKSLPMSPLRGISAFPNTVLNFDVERPKSIAALDAAMADNRRVFLLAQRDLEIEEPELSDLYVVGTVCRIRQLLRIPGGGVRVLVEGVSRARLQDAEQTEPYFVAEVSEIRELPPTPGSDKAEALIRHTRELVTRYVELSPPMNNDILMNISGRKNEGFIADYLAQNLYLKHSDKQRILEEAVVLRRVEKLNRVLENELEVMTVENEIREKTHERMMQGQRAQFLREQMRKYPIYFRAQ